VVLRWATGWLTGCSSPGKGWEFFSSPPALGPTQPPSQWAPGALSLGVKRPGREADHSSPSSAEVNAWSHTSTLPIRLHDVVLSRSTGTNLPLHTPRVGAVAR
jgi:hypothetical protein